MPMVDTGSYATGTITTSQDASAKAKDRGSDSNGGRHHREDHYAEAGERRSRTRHRRHRRYRAGRTSRASCARTSASRSPTSWTSTPSTATVRPVLPATKSPSRTGCSRASAPRQPRRPPSLYGRTTWTPSPMPLMASGRWTKVKSTSSSALPPTPCRRRRSASRLSQNRAAATAGRRQTPGDKSAAAYLRDMAGMFWTSSRMPDAVSTIQEGIIYRAGRAGMGASSGMRTAVCPV